MDASLNPGRNLILVNNREDATVKVTGAEVNDAAFTVQVTPVVDGQRYQLTVMVKPDASSGSRDAVLTIRTTDPAYPQVTVPVRANLK